MFGRPFISVFVVNVVVKSIIKTATLIKGKVHENLELICVAKTDKGLITLVVVPSPMLGDRMNRYIKRMRPGKVFSAELGMNVYSGKFGPIPVEKVKYRLRRVIFTRRTNKQQRDFIKTL